MLVLVQQSGGGDSLPSQMHLTTRRPINLLYYFNVHFYFYSFDLSRSASTSLLATSSFHLVLGNSNVDRIRP